MATRRAPVPAVMRNVNTVMKTEPRCLICNSKVRLKIDKLLAAGFSNTDCAQELMDSDQAFADKHLDTVRRNVERHAKSHLDIRNRAVREMVERRAREAGVMVDTAVGKITTGRALLDLIVSKATEQAADPDSAIKYADALEAVKMLEDVQKAEYVHQLETLQNQVSAISEAVKELVPAHLLPSIVARAEELFSGSQVLEIDAKEIAEI